MRLLRYLIRVPLLLLYLLITLPILLTCLLPAIEERRIGKTTLGDFAVRHWCTALMRIFGFRITHTGTPNPGATLFVANHISWVDIIILDSQRFIAFVAKKEISKWPLIGWLASRGHTIYHQRGSTDSLTDVITQMIDRLNNTRSVAVFPEGGTRNGTRIGPFHARIFQAAVETQVPVQPIAIVYGKNGNAQAQVAFQPRESFFANILRLLGEPTKRVQVHFLQPISTIEINARRQLAELARTRIIAVVENSPEQKNTN